MVVDDDLSTLPLYEHVAKSDDTIITIQKGGLSALRFLDSINYDVDAVIVDLSMPDMDGITLSQEIRRQEHLRSINHPVMIVWFTGWQFNPDDPNDPLLVAQAEYDVKKICRKPCLPIDLIREVNQMLDGGQ